MYLNTQINTAQVWLLIQMYFYHKWNYSFDNVNNIKTGKRLSSYPLVSGTEACLSGTLNSYALCIVPAVWGVPEIKKYAL